MMPIKARINLTLLSLATRIEPRENRKSLEILLTRFVRVVEGTIVPFAAIAPQVVVVA